MLLHPIGYHWQPVAYAFIALVRAVWGENAGAFQWVNLAQLVSVGFLTYALGRRATGDPGVGFVASLLYLGSAAFYEASYWPLAGNMHLLAAQLYLVTLVVAWDVGTGTLAARRPLAPRACALAAVLAHPAMATVVPVAGLTLWLVSRERGTLSRRSRRFALGSLALVAAAALGQRALAKALSTAAVPPPGFDRERLYRIAMAIADMAVLRGSTDLGHALVGLGGGFDSPRMSWASRSGSWCPWSCWPMAAVPPARPASGCSPRSTRSTSSASAWPRACRRGRRAWRRCRWRSCSPGGSRRSRRVSSACSRAPTAPAWSASCRSWRRCCS
jgi:hypothetical protein